MQRNDIQVEVRDKNLQRLGLIKPRDLQLKATLRRNSVDEWTLVLPGSHPMANHLATPGSGIIVYQREGTGWRTVMSGPTSKPNQKRDQQNPDGLRTFSGVSDDVLLADAVAYGDPANSIAAQASANDTRTGAAETLLREYVRDNVGTGALAARRTGLRAYLATGTSGGLGPTVTKAPRFQSLLSLCQELATLGALRFKVVQVGAALVLQVESVQDRSALVRLDVRNGTLASEEVEASPPTVTRVLVAGQGEGTSRAIVERTNAAAVSAEAEWGRTIEVWQDARDKATVGELEQTGDELLAQGGSTLRTLRAVAADDQTMRYGADWLEGDLVTVVVDGLEYVVTVESAALALGPDAVLVGAGIGNPSALDENAKVAAKVESNTQRISGLERTAEAAAVVGSVVATPGTLVERDGAGRAQFANPSAAADADTKGARDAAIAAAGFVAGDVKFTMNVLAEPHWLEAAGQTVVGGATTYPALAAAQPSWVSGGNLVMPNMRDRFPVVAGGAYAVGAQGGADAHTHSTPTHSHSVPSHTHTTPDHTHTTPDHSHDLGGGFNYAQIATGVAGTPIVTRRISTPPWYTTVRTTYTGSSSSANETTTVGAALDGDTAVDGAGTTGAAGAGTTGATGGTTGTSGGTTGSGSNVPKYHGVRAYIKT